MATPSSAVSSARTRSPRVRFALACVLACVSLTGRDFIHAQSGIALVQHVSRDAGTTTSATLPLTTNNAAGNWIGVAIRAGRTGQTFAVSDSRGNVYRSAVQFNVTVDTPAGDTLAIFYAENVTSGANTITVSQSTSTTLRFAILEYRGIAASNSLDGAIAAQGTSAAPNSGNLTTSAAGDLLFGAIVTANGASPTTGSGYTIEERVPTAPGTKLLIEDRIQPAAGTAVANASLGASDKWAAALTAFKAATTGTAGPTITSLTPASGVIGTSVTIAGTNFGTTQGTSAIRFNGIAAAAATWSASSLVVQVPTGATSGNVVVTVGGQPSNGMSFSVTSVLDTQAPTTPASLTATASGGNQIALNWTPSTDNVGVTAYRVEQCLGAGCTTFTEIGTVNSGGGPSTGPLTASANPNYFKDASGTPLILNGSHAWNTLQDWGSNGTLHTLDFPAFVNFLVAHGHNVTYLWAIETPKFCGLPTSASSPPDFTVGPHPWQRTGPGNATDGAMKFDLTKFNQAYFDRLRTRAQALNAAGIYAGVYLFTGEWLNQYRCATDGYPFSGANNINSVDAGSGTVPSP